MDKEEDKKVNNEGKKESVIHEHSDVSKEDNALNARINRLYGIASSEDDQPRKEYDPEELKNIRKKLVILLFIVVLFIILIFIMLFNPFHFGKEKDSTTNNTSPDVSEPADDDIDDNQTDDNQEEEETLGDMELTDALVNQLNARVTFNFLDAPNYDFFALYMKDRLTSQEFPNSLKLYFIKNSAYFSNFLINDIDTFASSCDDTGLIIEKETFDQIVDRVLGPDVTLQYDAINYLYYNNSITRKITFSYVEDKYIGKCNEYTTNTELTKLIQQQLVKATRVETGIEIYQKVVFISKAGVFKDPNLTNLITNDTSAVLEDYIGKGNTYKYMFIKDENNYYYLSSIELVKEDNA